MLTLDACDDVGYPVPAGVQRYPAFGPLVHLALPSVRRWTSCGPSTGSPSRSGIQDAGFAIIEDRQPSFVLDGVLLVTGEADRTTEFETGFPIHQAWREGDWVPDPLIHDDQAVVLHVRDKGLVVLTGFGHSGIVNIVRHAKALTGVDQVYAVLESRTGIRIG